MRFAYDCTTERPEGVTGKFEGLNSKRDPNDDHEVENPGDDVTDRKPDSRENEPEDVARRSHISLSASIRRNPTS